METPGCSRTLLALVPFERRGALRHGRPQWPGDGQRSQSSHRLEQRDAASRIAARLAKDAESAFSNSGSASWRRN